MLSSVLDSIAPEAGNSLLLISTAALLLFFLWYRRTDPRYPPCPATPLPIFGHMFMIKKNPRAQLEQWRKDKGDLYSFYVGSTMVVVLNGYELIKEALVTNAHAFSNRPKVYVDQIDGTPNCGVMASSGPNWKEQRSVTLSILKSLGMGKNIIAEKIQEETALYLDLLESFAGQPVDLRVHTNMSIANIVCSITVGHRFDYDDAAFRHLVFLMNYSISKVQGTSLLNFLPFLRYLPGDLFCAKKVKACVMEMNQFFAENYVKSGGSNAEGNVDSFVKAYMKERRDKLASGKTTFMDDENLLKIIVELFGAGMETVSSTILWCVLYILHHPDVQDKIHRELDSVVGGGDDRPLLDLRDKTKLTYLNAVVMETQRLASVVPLSAPHVCSEDVALRGFTIPKGCNVLPNLDSVFRDVTTWGADAARFRPERFIDGNGDLLHPEEFIPFSVGKRACLGESVARMELFLYLSAMFHRFEFTPDADSGLPPLREIFGIVVVPEAFKVIVNRRNGVKQ